MALQLTTEVGNVLAKNIQLFVKGAYFNQAFTELQLLLLGPI